MSDEANADKDALRLVVLGDSTAFTDDRGPQLPDDRALYPRVIAAILEDELLRPVTLNVIARAGFTVRDAHRVALKDRHVQFEVLRGADAVVIGVSSIDHAPAGIPTVLEAIVPFLRPASIRRTVRDALNRAHPFLAAATGSRFAKTPLNEFLRLYDGLLFQVRALTQGAAGVVMGPTSHNSAYFGWRHPRRAEREQLQFAIARRHGFSAVPCWPLVEPHVDRLNPDGLHWPPDVHAAIGEALARPLVAQLGGEAPRPPAPRWQT